jgi:hypothetical protein
MDENAKLLLELTRKQESRTDHEPVMHDVNSLLEEGRKRVYTAEGQKLVEAAQRRSSEKT